MIVEHFARLPERLFNCTRIQGKEQTENGMCTGTRLFSVLFLRLFLNNVIIPAWADQEEVFSKPDPTFPNRPLPNN